MTTINGITQTDSGASSLTNIMANFNALNAGKVETTTTVNGHALSGNVTVIASDVGLGNVDNTSDVTKNAAAVTLQNKRVTRRLVAVTQAAAPAINTDVTDVASITGLAQAITSFTSGLTGTPVNGDLLEIRITDNGTARAITWGASFASTTVTLPTTTVISTMLRIGFEWNSTTSKWECIAVA